MAQMTLLYPWLLLALPVLWLLLLAVAWRRRFKPFGPFLLRLLILVLVILALARPVFLPPDVASEESAPQRQVLLVDQSASLGALGQAALRAEAARLAQIITDTVTVYFADKPVVILQDQNLQPPNVQPSNVQPTNPSATLHPPFGGQVPGLQPEHTNLAEALAMGANLLNGQPGRLVLLSDGLPTAGDTTQAAANLARRGIPVDVILPAEADLLAWRGGNNEVRLVKLGTPATLRQGETFAIEVTAHSLTPAQVTLNLTQGDKVLAEDAVNLAPGLNQFSFEAQAAEIGPQTFKATLIAVPTVDSEAVNNSLSAFSQVYPSPKILLVGLSSEVSRRLNLQLRQAGFEVDRLNPTSLPTRLSELEPYAGMVLIDVPARGLQLEQMVAVQEFGRSLGRGLLVIGGRNSFSLGGYEDTPLADLLPVSLEPPPREERPPVALLLVIDHSGSMAERSENATKLAMAKEAAIRATDMLGPQDLIGVLMFDDKYDWVVPFRPVSDGADLLDIQQRIARVPGGGGTRILQALQIGLPALAGQQANSSARHAVLLTDGKSFDGVNGREAYDLVVDAAREANITLSAIAIGANADQELLAYLAERGQGRYHFAATPDALPALTVAESDILRSNVVQEDEYSPALAAPHPMLRGLPPQPASAETPGWPLLAGYLAQMPKPRAEVVLQVGPGDPLLSVWGYGLGRVAAWTSDAGDEWAGDWSAWPEAGRFWGQVMGYTLPAPGLGLLQLQGDLSTEGVLTLMAEGVTATNQPVDLAPTEATLTTPAGREIPLTLRQIAPGRYQQRLRLPDPGAYLITVAQNRGDEPAATATIGLVAPYPAEYGLPSAGTGEPLLRQIAESTGGEIFGLRELLADSQLKAGGLKIEDGEMEDGGLRIEDGLISHLQSLISNPQSLIPLWAHVSNLPFEPWFYLLLAALILWPIEIAWRRWSRLRIQ
jgi:uncharacterized membrane protein